jgi:hypothetical protein
MKKIGYLALTALFIGLAVACSSTPASPSAALKTYYDALMKGDYEKFVDGIYFSEAKTSAEIKEEKEGYLALLKDKVDKSTDSDEMFTDIEVLSEEILEDGNNAVVKVKYIYANGKTTEDSCEMIKKDGKWLMEIDK